ncbi:small GTP-binding protein [Histomonas meleagridis]|uniref:small GTP-binding protein n=1 Tax=Histomonas meleagridis TaxID=135588 RepID=UPI0035597841|nr:small GTP-binding protein [Histomonas meleagridis]KAH0806452.1 small GTP-binding protein [Histomonas meleagridis]
MNQEKPSSEEYYIDLYGRYNTGKSMLISKIGGLDYGTDLFFECKSIINYQGICITTNITVNFVDDFAPMRVPRPDAPRKGFIILYSMVERDSFEYVNECYQDITRCYRNPLVYLCASKCDLVEERVVSQEEGEELAKQIGAFYMEISAKNNINVHELFYGLVEKIYQRNHPTVNQTPPKEQKSTKKEVCTVF